MSFDVELEITEVTAKCKRQKGTFGVKGMGYKMRRIKGSSELCFKKQAFSLNEKLSEESHLSTLMILQTCMKCNFGCISKCPKHILSCNTNN